MCLVSLGAFLKSVVHDQAVIVVISPLLQHLLFMIVRLYRMLLIYLDICVFMACRFGLCLVGFILLSVIAGSTP
jgi:hypothetical protein